MRLLYFFRSCQRPDANLPDVTRIAFTKKVEFLPKLKSTDFELTDFELVVKKKEEYCDFAENLFLNDANNKVINFTNAIVGSNGAGKTTTLEEIARFSLPKRGNGHYLWNFTLEIVELNNKLVIYYSAESGVSNKDCNPNLNIKQAQEVLKNVFNVSNVSIIKLNNHYDKPKAFDFSMVIFSNDERDRGEWYRNNAKAHQYSITAQLRSKKKAKFVETGLQITKQAIEQMGEKYFELIAPQTTAVVNKLSSFNYLLKEQSKRLGELFYIRPLMHLLFADKLLDKKLDKGVFKYLFEKHIEIIFININEPYFFDCNNKHILKNAISDLNDWKVDDKGKIKFPSLEEKKKREDEWLKKNTKSILKNGLGQLRKLLKGNRFLRDRDKDFNEIYYYILNKELFEKFNSFPNNSVVNTLKYNLLFELCVAFNCILDIIDCKNLDDALEKAMQIMRNNSTEDALVAECDDARYSVKPTVEELKQFEYHPYLTKLTPDYFTKAQSDLAELEKTYKENPKLFNGVGFRGDNYASSTGKIKIEDNKELVKFFANAAQNKAFYIKYLSIKGLGFSSGEARLLNMFSSLNTNLNPFFDKGIELKENVLLLIDDLDRDCHPKWQLKIFNELIKVFNELYSNKNVHLIFSTHSPMLLSDIPKECVIPILSSKDKNSPNLNISTFGANVFDLYKDAFFVKDGYIGAYAKAKIDQAVKIIREKYIDYLKGIQENAEFKIEVESLNEVGCIIELIGEPILKNKLKSMINEMTKGEAKDDRNFAK